MPGKSCSNIFWQTKDLILKVSNELSGHNFCSEADAPWTPFLVTYPEGAKTDPKDLIDMALGSKGTDLGLCSYLDSDSMAVMRSVLRSLL